MAAANGGDMIKRNSNASTKNGSDTIQNNSSTSNANNAEISPEANSIETNDIDVTIHDEQNNLNLDQKDQDIKTNTYSKKFERNVLGSTYYRAWPHVEKSSQPQT